MNSKISDERFAKMSASYEKEKGEVTRRIKVLRIELKNESGKLLTTDAFIEIVRRYTDAQEVTQRMVT